ncbi:AAA domain-containing protein [Thermodesulfobacterium sp. TA1]|uniref:AAA family ATPase n=1 Tax=Thermodesulfobacterium sp. TA1 TaxID=2234087 RepID=UPI00123245CA|nr:AAA family ATPase [Thermodesulfobacterium sp. TA1]QER42179.1 AAA domain-containing protein [Thermodesulfobacterium sp. TA1]
MIKSSKLKLEKLSSERFSSIYEFDLKPLELESFLNDYVVGQKEAKAVISTKICTHFQKIKHYVLKRNEEFDFVKNNLLIIGPTGVGKTYVMKLIAKKIGVPFVKGDATKFSETGYVGGDIEDLIRELYWEAEGDLEKAHYGMIFLDEIDKIASTGENIGPDVSRTGVQRALLKPLEETTVEIKLPPEVGQSFNHKDFFEKNRKKKLVLNTKHVLFVASGAFQGLEEIIKKRLRKQKMGFLSDLEEKIDQKINYLKFVSPEDLVNYGFEREFVGRFPVIVVFDPLSEEDLFEILANPNNPIVLNKKKDFNVYGITLAFTNGALKEIARLASQENTGARALAMVLERVLIPYERVLSSKGLKYLGVTEELVKDPEGILQAMLSSPKNERWMVNFKTALLEEEGRFKDYLNSKNDFWVDKSFDLTPKRVNLLFSFYLSWAIEPIKVWERLFYVWQQIKNYEKFFENRYKLRILFSEEAIDLIIERVIKKEVGVFSLCDKIMSRLKDELVYLRDVLGINHVVITPEAFKNPEKFCEEILKNKMI